MGLFAVLALASSGCGGAETSNPGTGPSIPLKVLTWNLYLGADLSPLAAISTPQGIPDAAAAMWKDVQDSDFPARAKVIAARIAALSPDLVALQEVSLYRRQAPSDFAADHAPNAITVELDFLQLVLDELAALGAKYRLAIEAPNADVELPVNDGADGLFDLRVTDRDVLLVNDFVVTTGGMQQKFLSKLNLPVGGAGGVSLAFTRSACHVQFQNSVPITFATSHLEIGALQAVQAAQANELMGFMNAIQGPIVLVGDFNAAPDSPNYKILTKSFHDLAATHVPPAEDTCCQSGDLMMPTSQAGERIDLVLTRGAFKLDTLTLVGADPVADRTPSGKWASDHFGVYAELTLN